MKNWLLPIVVALFSLVSTAADALPGAGCACDGYGD
jgi:hypothetical protein